MRLLSFLRSSEFLRIAGVGPRSIEGAILPAPERKAGVEKIAVPRFSGNGGKPLFRHCKDSYLLQIRAIRARLQPTSCANVACSEVANAKTNIIRALIADRPPEPRHLVASETFVPRSQLRQTGNALIASSARPLLREPQRLSASTTALSCGHWFKAVLRGGTSVHICR